MFCQYSSTFYTGTLRRTHLPIKNTLRSERAMRRQLAGELFVGERAAELRLFPQGGGRRHILPGIDVVRAQAVRDYRTKTRGYRTGTAARATRNPFFPPRARTRRQAAENTFCRSFQCARVRKNQFVAADIVIFRRWNKTGTPCRRIAESAGVQPVEQGTAQASAPPFSVRNRRAPHGK